MENLEQNEVVLNDDQIICSLTNKIVKATDKELTLQSMIGMMTEEYDFAQESLERDFKVKYVDGDTGKNKTIKIDLAVFEKDKKHDQANLIRAIIVTETKVKSGDKSKGVAATLDNILENTDCEFGCWTNGEDLLYKHAVLDDWQQATTEDLSDFPSEGQTLEDLIESSDKAMPRKPANDSLVRTFRRCHDYLYGNEGRKKDAFWELLNVIFCKLYDEKRRFLCAERRESYRRQFWVGVNEQSTPEGQAAVAKRIKAIFELLKQDNLFKEVFEGNEMISISDRGLAYVAGELAKYSFLDATVDVKGTAYETIVSNTLKQSAGQFFTPRNIIKCMVEMMDPDQNTRVLDPACGSGGFLVMVLDHVRKKITKDMYPELDDLHLEQKYNTEAVNAQVRNYAERMIFGFDFDPDLRKAARMNMVMAGDGHANIYNINSLDYPDGQLPDVGKIAPRVQWSIENSYDHNFVFATAKNNAHGKFDMIFTNPPFGSNVEVDPEIAAKFKLAEIANTKAPEVLFVEACYNLLKPGGKAAIVLPDGILSNPKTEIVRKWILERFFLMASVDLPVETFKPQVGVQASLLFLKKKTSKEISTPIEEETYDIFMAIAERVGKDLRGNPIYQKDNEGADLLFENTKKWIAFNENGREIIRTRRERIKRLADDLPSISKAYKEFLNNHRE